MLKKVISFINYLSAIILLIIIFFSNISTNFMYIIAMTLFIGWILPFISLIISGISLHSETHPKLTLTYNIISLLLSILLLFLIIKLFNKELISTMICYIMIIIINIINIIYLIIYLKNHPDPEIKRIKEEKKKNNGAVV